MSRQGEVAVTVRAAESGSGRVEQEAESDRTGWGWLLDGMLIGGGPVSFRKPAGNDRKVDGIIALCRAAAAAAAPPPSSATQKWIN